MTTTHRMDTPHPAKHKQTTNHPGMTKGVASAIIGSFAVPTALILVGIFVAIPAIVLGHLSLADQRYARDDTARVVAIIGLGLGYGSIILMLLVIVLVAAL